MSIRTFAILVSGIAAGSAHGALVADYQLQNTYATSVGSAPALAPIGSPAFASDSVYGSQQTVLQYAAGAGVALTPTDGILGDGTTYTILVRSRHDQTGGYVKLIDFSADEQDTGLYDDGGALDFYDLSGGATSTFGYGYSDVVLTRSSDGTLAGYVNGVLELTADDSATLEGVIDSHKQLTFFVDDMVTGGFEASAGAVARIEIWNTALNTAEVAALSADQIFGDGFEAGPVMN
jgi:hypothetical protein